MSAPRMQRTPEQALATLGEVSGRWLGLCLFALALGVLGFFLTIGPAPQRAWLSVWVNFLFWTSLAMAGVVFGAILQAAKGHWGMGFRRVAEAAGAFLPVSFVLFVLLYLGAEYVLPWLGEVDTEHLNRDWLTLDGVFLRNGVMLLILYLASFAFLWHSLRADAPLVAERQTGWRRSLARALSRNWRGDEEEMERCRRRMTWMSPLLILAWVMVFSMLSYDLAMSLVPGFISVVWGPYFFVGGWLCLLALVALVAAHYEKRYGSLWDKWEFHDLGKLMFAFVVFWTYLWFSQFLVIWFGNIPREANFFIPRTGEMFSTIYWLQMVLIFALPFLFLLGRNPKMNPRWLGFVALLILLGFWLERYNLIVPSVWEGDSLPLGWPEVSISIGFLGLFGICYALFASAFPKVPIRDNLMVGTAGHGP